MRRPTSPARSDTTPALASHRVHRRGSTLTTTFRDLGIFPETAEALEAVGIINPFPIQEMTLPVALTGTDIIGQAKTGTGKTLGFGLPLLERVIVPADVEAGRAKPEDLVDSPQALVVVPTRELCTQVTNDLLTAGKVRNVRVTAIYGGRAYEPQVEALKKGVDVVIGTPGRLLDLAGQKKLNLKHVKCLVLDEADEMLDLGFLPDVEKIINMLPARRQTMLFSATMPGAVIGLARRYMSQPTHISATSPDDEGATVRNTAQHIYRAHNMDKPEIVSRILQADGRGLVMVFCRTKRTAADLADQLKQRGFASGAVHGDLGQGAREQALRAFRNGKVDVLVCTDVAARGIDVEGVTHVINYQSPEDEKTYLHRIGRTGRAGAKGIAITLVDWDDIPRWQLINKALDLGFNDPPETYSTSPHLFEELSIPAGTKGVLPRSERTRAGLDAEELEDLGEPGGRGPRGRGGRSSAPSSSAERERERPARTPRRRRRTRGGATVDGASPEAAAVTRPSESAGAPDAGSIETEAESRTPRRRRRTRAGSNSAAEAVVETVGGTSAETETVTESVAGSPAESVEEAPKPRRRRARKSVEAAEAPVAEAPAAEAALDTAEGVTAEEAPAKPRRRTHKAVAPAEAEAAATETQTLVEEAPAAPRRRTRKAATPAVEATDSAAEAAVDTVEEPKPRRRTRKTAATAETVVEAVAEEAAPAPRRRTRKAVAPAEAPAAEAALDTAEGVTAEEAPAKPRRRTHKAVAPVEPEAAATETQTLADEAPAAPRRRTRKAATPAVEATDSAAEAAVDTVEEPKPRRRTRKTAATAEAAVPAQPTEEQATKPRRTRKAAASAVAAEAEVAAEAPAPRRRTRKAAAAVEAAEG
ncbi:DEAD/DEAH box helicase [Streptomyces scabiei]|uniref:DEAD/DEAH box helicase n=1 Tax=Streptomyces scabiei TaxID=1930 RepID=UPI00298F576F|nr:DEAD/DEAH box helicase [Streptomyces scabiei]MDW8804845.1 DEAD/DEAH box helicase [Streptomyces scabiei]